MKPVPPTFPISVKHTTYLSMTMLEAWESSLNSSIPQQPINLKFYWFNSSISLTLYMFSSSPFTPILPTKIT